MILKTNRVAKAFKYLKIYSHYKLNKQIIYQYQHIPLKFINKQNTLTWKNKYYYRSQDQFIDFKKDYYQILGLQQNAQIHEIKQRFYILAKQYHPDKQEGSQQKFKQINQAYNVLSQAKLKKFYDQNRQNEDFIHENNIGHQKKSTLNYEPYSQMSRAQWARVRQGVMKHCPIDYSNYQKFYNPEQNLLFRYKNAIQWQQALSKITPQQIQQQKQFINKLYKKTISDIEQKKRLKQQIVDSKFQKIGDKIQNIFGKKIRKIYDKIIQK